MKPETPPEPVSEEFAAMNFAVKLMEHLVVPTFVLDAECRVVIWNRACERLTGVPAHELFGTREHWRAFYDAPRPCLADLIAQGRTAEIEVLYATHEEPADPAQGAHGRRAENWCVMPQVGTRLYLAIDAGPIYDDEGRLIAVVETLRDMTVQQEAQMELQRLATRDSLTGIANRRSFDDTLAAEWLRGIRDAKPLSLILIDVDHFKHYNDHFGHQGGDECLKAVAGTIGTSCLRSSDLAARYGGEEFTAVLPGTSAAGGMIVAERIRAAVAAHALPHPGNDARGHVTVSVGIATLIPSRDRAPEDLIAAADAALYRAKREGRDRVVAAEPPRLAA